jgi:hypothetical protein
MKDTLSERSWWGHRSGTSLFCACLFVCSCCALFFVLFLLVCFLLLSLALPKHKADLHACSALAAGEVFAFAL